MINSRLTEVRAKWPGGISIARLAKETGIARATLQSFSLGRASTAKLSTVNALCKYFGCGVGDLLEYVPETEEAK